MATHAFYQPLVEEYIGLFKLTKPVFDFLARLPEAEGTHRPESEDRNG
jgi:hypothetical protein